MPQTTTEEIKAKLDIADIVREYIELKPAGTNLKALCPFHNEKTPSFMVSQERQMYHCFGCGEHGDIFTFIQKMEGIEFPEALHILAKRAGVEIRTQDPRLRNERTKLYDILKFTSKFYQAHLRNLKEDHPVKQYVKKRGLTDELIDAFQIGYAPDSWDALYSALNKKNVRAGDAQTAGLLVRKDDGSGYYDRFRARLMFPVMDVHGNIVGFGGRTIPDMNAQSAGKEAAKYINTPQSPVYNKSAILYGLHLAKNAIRTEKRAVVVEGYMDCIAAHKAKSECVVAASGTAFTQDQAKLLKRFTNTVIVSFDMDEAGIAAAGRSVAVLLAQGLTVRVLSLPGKKDPDELIREDPKKWQDALSSPQLFLDFAFDRAVAGKDLTDVQAKKNIAATLLPLIAPLADGVEQSHYLQKLGEVLRVEEAVLRESMKKIRMSSMKPQVSRNAESGQLPGDSSLELMSILLKDQSLAPDVFDRVPDSAMQHTGVQRLYSVFRDQYNQHKEINPTKIREILMNQADSGPIIEILDVVELGISRLSEEVQPMKEHLVNAIMREHVRSQLKALSENIARAEKANDKTKLEQLVHTFETLTKELKKFTSNM